MSQFELVTSFVSIIAATIAVVVSMGAYFHFQKKIREKEESKRNESPSPTVPPGATQGG